MFGLFVEAVYDAELCTAHRFYNDDETTEIELHKDLMLLKTYDNEDSAEAFVQAEKDRELYQSVSPNFLYVVEELK